MIELILNPTKTHLHQIEKWLIDERNQYNEGFYCNWNNINNHFNNKELFCLVEGEQAIGFVCWRIFEKTVHLNIVEIMRFKRGSGLGRMMVEDSLEVFKKKGALVADIECSPTESEPVWRKWGFIEYQKSEYITNPTKFNSLIPYQKLLTNSETNSHGLKVELWNGEPWETKKLSPNWSWLINYKNNTKKLQLPIVYPANQNWRMRLTQDSEVLYDGKIKHRKDVDNIHFGSFLIIQEIA
jgi:GNAT superfamily N-acetyltransferase